MPVLRSILQPFLSRASAYGFFHVCIKTYSTAISGMVLCYVQAGVDCALGMAYLSRSYFLCCFWCHSDENELLGCTSCSAKAESRIWAYSTLNVPDFKGKTCFTWMGE